MKFWKNKTIEQKSDIIVMFIWDATIITLIIFGAWLAITGGGHAPGQ